MAINERLEHRVDGHLDYNTVSRIRNRVPAEAYRHRLQARLEVRTQINYLTYHQEHSKKYAKPQQLKKRLKYVQYLLVFFTRNSTGKPKNLSFNKIVLTY